MALLEVSGLNKRFGGIRAVKEINLRVEEGEIVGLIGPNGSGKSTLLSLITGVHKPDSGTICFGGCEIQKWPVNKRIKQGMAIVFQHSRPLHRQTVLDNIKLALLPDRVLNVHYPANIEERAREAAKRLGLEDVMDAFPGSLPFGYLRRMEVAKALALNPRLLLLDEPFAGLTPSEVGELADLILSARDQKQAIVLVDHNVKAVYNFVGRIVALYLGSKIADGDPREVMAHPEVRRVYLGKSLEEADETPLSMGCGPNNENLLEVDIRSLKYGKAEILRDVTIRIREGEFASIVGLNGAGKSSLLKAITGLVDYAGEVKWRGKSTQGMTTAQIIRSGVAFAPETRELFRHMSVRENLEMGGDRLNRQELEARLENIYGLFPILKERVAQPAYTLSGGEQQMLTIGRALMQGPSLLILDEPTLGLAPVVLEAISEALLQLHHSKGLTILLAEQNLHFALKHSNTIYFLDHGSVGWHGPVADFRGKVGDRFLVSGERVERA
ncbi:MAG: ATP-binding cassette domain-containing protein [Syntrophobacteraceae bacterium]